MKKINFKGASWDSMFLAFVKILTILTSIVLTKILSTGLSLMEYGTYSQANVIISICTSFLLLGLGDALNYFYNNQIEKKIVKEKIKIVNTIYFLEIIIGILLALFLIFIRSNIAGYFSNILLKNIIVIISLKPMLDNILYFYQILYISTGKAKIIAIRNLIIAVIKIVIMYIAVNILKKIEVIFLALVILDLFQLIFFKIYFSLDCFFVNPFRIKISFIKEILRYSLPMGIFAITNVLTRDIDKLIIGKMSTTEVLAIYTNCSKILPFDIIVVSFATVLIPYIMRYINTEQKKEGLLLFKNYIKIGYYSVWIFGTAVLIVSKQAINFLYSKEYVTGNIIFILYLFDSMLRFASMHLILTAKGESKKLMKYSIISLMINISLNIIFYKFIGITGPAIATLVTAFIYIYLVLNRTITILETTWLEVFELKDIFRFVLTLSISGIIVYFFNKWIIKIGFNYYLSMIISISIFISINFIFNIKKIIIILKNINNLKI